MNNTDGGEVKGMKCMRTLIMSERNDSTERVIKEAKTIRTKKKGSIER